MLFFETEYKINSRKLKKGAPDIMNNKDELIASIVELLKEAETQELKVIYQFVINIVRR